MGERGALNLYAAFSNDPCSQFDPLGQEGQSNLDLLREELGEDSYDATMCKTFADVAHGVLNETPIGQGWLVATGTGLDGEKAGAAARAAAAGGFFLPIAKKVITCCKAKTVCLMGKIFSRAKAVDKFPLPEGGVMIGVVRDGKIISKTLPNTSHGAAAAAAGALDDAGKLRPGCSVFTVIKEDGKLTVLGSQNFGGILNISDETIKAVLDEFH